jgi:hypothetical protein
MLLMQISAVTIEISVHFHLPVISQKIKKARLATIKKGNAKPQYAKIEKCKGSMIVAAFPTNIPAAKSKLSSINTVLTIIFI